MSDSATVKKDGNGASFTDLLFSTLFGATFALKLQNLYTIACPIPPYASTPQTFDIAKGFDIFAIYAVYSVLFIIGYWHWIHDDHETSKLKIIRTFTATLAPFLGWEFAIYVGFAWRGLILSPKTPMEYWSCFPTSSVLNIQALNVNVSIELYILLALIQVGIVSWTWKLWHWADLLRHKK